MKLWTLITLCTVSLLVLSGCATKPSPSANAAVDATLPVVVLTEKGVFVDMNTIAFEWQSIKDPRVNGVYVYRQIMNKGDAKQEYYDTVDNRFATHYVDTKIEPDTQYSYHFKTFSNTAESKRSSPILVKSLPVLSSVSWIHSIQNMPKSAKVIWRPHENKIVKAYIIERRTLKDNDWQKIATVEGRFSAEYIDTKLEDGYVYKYRIRVLTFDGLISEPSEVVTSITKVLPNGVNNIAATMDLPRKIRISWNAIEDLSDFSAYSVYRSEKLDGSYKALKTTQGNQLIDSIDEDGKSYFYRVSVVDKDGLESNNEKQSVQGQTLSKADAPSIIEARIIENRVEISWVSMDSSIKNYAVTKKQKSLFGSSSEDFTGINDTVFVDTAIEPETTYFYQVYGVDKNSIKSRPSIEIKLTTTKNQGRVINKKQKTKKASQAPSEIPSEDNGSDNKEIIKPIQDLIEN